MTSIRRLFSALCATLVLAGPAPAAEDTAAVAFKAEYDFYLGGLRIADSVLQGRIGAQAYHATSEVATRGMFDMFRISANVSARVEGNRHERGYLAPARYATEYATDGEEKQVRMTWAGSIPSVAVAPAPPARLFKSSTGDHAGALDPLSAALATMHAENEADICNRTIPVFDGTRRYDIILLPEDRRPENKDFQPLNWDKPIKRCFGVYERISGFDDLQQTGERYYPFDIWFEVNGNGVNRIARVAGKTKLGHIMGILRR